MPNAYSKPSTAKNAVRSPLGGLVGEAAARVYTLPNGERLETDTVTKLYYYPPTSQRGPIYVCVERGRLPDVLFRFNTRSAMLSLVYSCTAAAGGPFYWSQQLRLTLHQLRLRGLRPRHGERSTRFNNRRWRLDQAIMIMPRNCPPALASAIADYNAAPTAAARDLVSVLAALA